MTLRSTTHLGEVIVQTPHPQARGKSLLQMYLLLLLLLRELLEHHKFLHVRFGDVDGRARMFSHRKGVTKVVRVVCSIRLTCAVFPAPNIAGAAGFRRPIRCCKAAYMSSTFRRKDNKSQPRKPTQRQHKKKKRYRKKKHTHCAAQNNI